MRPVLVLLCLLLVAAPGSAKERVWRLGVLIRAIGQQILLCTASCSLSLRGAGSSKAAT